MTAGAAALAGLNGVVRYVAGELHPFEAAFFRSLFGILFMLPWFWRVGLGGLRTRRLGLYTVRGALTVVATLSWFSAIAILPLAEVVALSFTAPLIAAAGATLILGEVVRARRWIAIGVGFVGVVVMLRPGAAALSPGAMLALLSAIAIAGSMLCIKALSRTETTAAIVTYMLVFLTPLSFLAALFVWQAPSPGLWPWLVAMGALGTAAHLCLTRAFATTEASVVLPFDYLRLPLVALIGFVFFAELPELSTWIGAGLIAGASGYLVHREAALARALGRAAAAAELPVAPTRR
jgi:drug/metabolite transporter (DMT)-like permease